MFVQLGRHLADSDQVLNALCNPLTDFRNYPLFSEPRAPDWQLIRFLLRSSAAGAKPLKSGDQT
jgi:hypothetical protein